MDYSYDTPSFRLVVAKHVSQAVSSRWFDACGWLLHINSFLLVQKSVNAEGFNLFLLFQQLVSEAPRR